MSTSTDAAGVSGARALRSSSRSFDSRNGRVGRHGSIHQSRWTKRALPAGIVIILVALGSLAAERWATEHIRATLGSSLTAVHETQIEGLRLWAQGRKREAWGLSRSVHVTAAALRALDSRTAVDREAAFADLHEYLRERSTFEGIEGFLLVAPSGKGYVYTDHVKPLGIDLLEQPSFLSALKGETTMSEPFLIKGERPSGFEDEKPSMFTFAAVERAGGELAGVLGFRMDPAGELSQVLELGSVGDTGETFAFDESGMMVSRSRFAQQLRQVDLIHSTGILEIPLKDPGKPVTHANDVTPELPLTLDVRAALAGKPGQNLEGWRDYRGREVVGNWSWVPELRLGLSTKVDREEAYEVLMAAQWAGAGLLVLLAGAGAVIIVFASFTMRLESRAAEVLELGQYKLVKKIGEGGMGTVYRAEHSLLARPTAVKLLKGTSRETLQRFEREVKLTARLSHPNTIAIYDYGFSGNGTFYCAMELLDGTDLERLVQATGPLPIGRALHIVKQVLGSLAEAHEAGLVHRDVKPANIMLTSRGGIPDFAKVLDFGLVRPFAVDNVKVTADQAIIGTPLYLAPETLTNSSAASPASDVYAVAAVLYFLLSGKDAFQAPTLAVVISRHVRGKPTPLASVIPGGKVPEGVDELLRGWMSRTAGERPENARAALSELEPLLARFPWSEVEARSAQHELAAMISADTQLAIA